MIYQDSGKFFRAGTAARFSVQPSPFRFLSQNQVQKILRTAQGRFVDNQVFHGKNGQFQALDLYQINRFISPHPRPLLHWNPPGIHSQKRDGVSGQALRPENFHAGAVRVGDVKIPLAVKSQ